MFNRFVKFFLTCLVGTVVDTVILWVCAHYIFHGNWVGEMLISPLISFECAVVTNFAFSYYFVWRDRITRIHSKRSLLRHFLGYNGSCVAGFIVKMAFLLMIKVIFDSYLFEIDVVYCNLLALCFSGIFNFLMSDQVIFRKRKPKTVVTSNDK